MPRELVSSRAGACPAFEATEVVLYTIALPVELFVSGAPSTIGVNLSFGFDHYVAWG